MGREYWSRLDGIFLMADDAKPSWQTSTLSQIAVASVACYLVGALYISFKSNDISSLKWAAEIFAASYLARGTKSNGGSNGIPKAPAPETPTTIIA